MISELRRLIENSEGDALVTVVRTEGHAYGKTGSRALYALDAPEALWGSLGALCVEETVREAVRKAVGSGRPRMARIDTRGEDDVDFGYGTFCGGLSELIVEPMTPETRARYVETIRAVESGQTVWLTCRFDPPEIVVSTRGPGAAAGSDEPNADDPAVLLRLAPPARLVLFGATALARNLALRLREIDIAITVSDWRPDRLDAFATAGVAHTCDESFSCDGDSLVLVMSHATRRDAKALRRALTRGSRWVGLLSSTSRRDYLFGLLADDGVPQEALARVSSPVGLDIGARGDAEIAVSIAAELIQVVRS